MINIKNNTEQEKKDDGVSDTIRRRYNHHNRRVKKQRKIKNSIHVIDKDSGCRFVSVSQEDGISGRTGNCCDKKERSTYLQENEMFQTDCN